MSRQPGKNPANGGTPQGGPGPALVVGLGASAGGLEPLQEFLQHFPAASGLVFVVIQHLEPSHPSMLAELLARHTAMPVLQASDGLTPEPDHVYVIAPGTLLTIDKSVLRVVASESPSSSPIDAFFHSLAEDQGEHAVGVLFSGAGHDGTVGLRAIKEHGGLTLAQPPETAKHDSMLQSAIGAGLADHVVPVAQMPAIIAEHAEHLARFSGADAVKNLDEQLAGHLGNICTLIHQRTGHDFSRYKEGTLLRRIRRRLQVQHLNSVEGYMDLLEKDSAEADGLLKDLLIGVTQFFRDPEAFQTLAQQIIPRIVQGKASDAPIRIWVPGCASGEEAYSIAILLREHLDRLETRRFVQIFATDLDAAMLAEARHGRYPADIADQVSPERLARFFVRDPSTGSGRVADFQAVKELREMCIFSEHSLIRDPPFSQLDLISCRNVLIYLNADLQKKLVPLFHYALRPGGFLFLGPSEGISGSPELFEPTDKRNRIFRRKETVARPIVEFPLSSRSAARVSGASPPQGILDRRAQTPHEKIGAAFERTVLEEYAAPSAVINQRGEVLFVAGSLSRHLQLPAGALTTNLLEAFRGNLRQELRMALRAAGDKRRKIVRKNISVESEDSTRRVHLSVRPMPAVEPEAGLFLVALQEMEPPEENGPEEIGASEAVEPVVEQLENELRSTRAELKTTVEELESANEEMKSSNEELISTNEELQSANEEMQTSKEELQSLNEELETVNTELRQKVDELGDANSDLQNLFAATEIATIFLDRSLRVAKFTPAATTLFHLIETDVGRPLADFAQRFAGQDLATDAQEVLRVLTPIERQVRSAQGAWFVLRVVPYRTVENLIAGVVVTFVDVTELKRAEDEVKRQGQLVHLSHDAILIWKLDAGIESWNRGAQELYGFSRDEAFGRVSQQLLQSTFPLPWPEIKAELLAGGCWAGDIQQRTKDGRAVIVSANFQLVLGEDGAARVLEANRDISERKAAEEALRLSEEKFAKAFHGNTAAMAITRLSDGLFIDVNQRYLEMTGWDRGDVVGDRSPRLNIWKDPKERDRFVRELKQHGVIRNAEFSFCRKGGEEWIGLVFSEVSALSGEQVIISSITDITERKKAEEALRESELENQKLLAVVRGEKERLSALVGSITDEVWFCDTNKHFTLANAPALKEFQIASGAAVHVEALARSLEVLRPDGGPRPVEEAPPLRALAGEIVKGQEETVRTPASGDLRYREVSASPVRDAAGQIIGSVSVVRDITDRKRAEEALRESEARFRTMANAIPQLAWMANPDGYITWYNQRWYEYTGTTAEQMEGWGWQRVHDPEELPSVLELWKGSIASGEPFDMVFPLRGADGVFRPFLTRGLPLKDADGRVVQWFGTNTDISERMKAEEALRVANAQLAEADQRKNEFLAVLSHELRNPLTPIRNSLYILERVAPGGDQARRAQEVIGRQSGQLARLVDDLLDVTRISRNKIQLQRGPLDLNELVRRTVEDHHSLFEGKRIAVETSFVSERLPISGDATRLAQILGNLLQNAAKFTPAGGRVAVSTTAAPARGRATLRVIDNGVGIEPLILRRLFEPFMQAEATLDRSTGGLGLGLALVKGLVEMHGGDVRAHSDGPGKGAEFVVELPLQAQLAEEALPREVGGEQIRRRVLIIEDNVDAADSLRDVLAFGDHVVEVAYNGPEGLARAREFKPEVVLCDIGLPGMDGFEVARAFRADDALKGVFLVALSGYALPEDLQRAHEAGFDRHLAKPPSIEKIEQVLASTPVEESRDRS